MEFPFEKLLAPLKSKLEQLDEMLSDPKVLSDQKLYRTTAKQRAEIEETLKTGREYFKILKSISDNELLIKEDPEGELAELANEELPELQEKLLLLETRLKSRLVPKDPEDVKNVIIEIRAGTGGEEAALFVADLYRMYSKYVETQGWKLDVMNSSDTGIGGFKEITFSVEGVDIYGDLKYESGIHRVQRVPVTETSGRLHTSAASVAVLPEAGDIDLKVDPNDLKIDVFRSSGPGGQSVNTTDSAVRITHLPTNTVVTCQDEKSQHKNKAKAFKVLRARLLDRITDEHNSKISKSRKSIVGSGDRSEKIKTYNFPQNRVTDHRIGLTLYNLDGVLNGQLDELINAAKNFAFEKKVALAEESKTKA
ncbi:MAG: peptide chain release factor 1 [candidate division Zixibacteria bacterium]|nr:peptide chain release factor 1 [candidate division Zixibacteria bacterium]